jgi:hypothetical protein
MVAELMAFIKRRGFMKKIENEKKRTAEVEAEIEAVQKEVAEQRKAVGGIKLAEQENLRKQKQVKALEVCAVMHEPLQWLAWCGSALDPASLGRLVCGRLWLDFGSKRRLHATAFRPWASRLLHCHNKGCPSVDPWAE